MPIFDPVFVYKRFFNFVNVFTLFYNYLPLGKGLIPSFEKKPTKNKTGVLITQGCFVPSIVEIGQVVLKKMIKL